MQVISCHQADGKTSESNRRFKLAETHGVGGTGRLFGGLFFSRNHQHIGICCFVKLLRSTLSYRGRRLFVEGGVGVSSAIVPFVGFKGEKQLQLRMASVGRRLRNSIHFALSHVGFSARSGDE
ncbi:MAG: hypothetical protein JWP89_5613 [Schlesneria sp.]|nr:hypothetical protein [Schlesneria sp.]